MKRFTVFRPDINHDDPRFPGRAYNPNDAPQYEGVIFHDGSVAIRWMTEHRSTSVWSNLNDMLMIHGHPEYGTVIEWHDSDPDGFPSVRWLPSGVEVPKWRVEPIDMHPDLRACGGL